MRQRPGRVLSLVAVLCSLSALAACGPPAPGPAPTQRLIETEPERLLDLQTRGRLAAGEAESISASLPGSWRVVEGGELRSAILTTAGAPRRWELHLPPHARLRFACSPAAFGAGAGAARVRIEAETGEDEVLFETDTDALPAGWQDAEIDLADFGGSRVTLIFETRPGGAEPEPLISAWADPIVRPAPAPGASAPGPNVVIVSIDTLRADHLSLYGYDRETSPHLDRWAGTRGVVFRETVAPSPWTLPSHVSLFTGQDALRHGVNFLSPAPASLEMLAERLHARGYRTVALTDGGYMHPRFGLSQGFDAYRFEYPASSRRERLPEAMDRLLEWLGVLAAGDEPFLLFFHTYAVHEPYFAREPYFERFGGEAPAPPGSPLRAETRERAMQRDEGFRGRRGFVLFDAAGREQRARTEDLARIGALYDSGIAYVDAQLPRLLEALDEPGLASRTLVVITSDHGEALGDHDFGGHGHLYDDTLLVPLVIAGPGLRGGRQVKTPVRLVDVAPTLLELLQLPVGAELDGASLVPLLDGDEAGSPRDAFAVAPIVNLGVALRTTDGLKYLYHDSPWPGRLPREELYVLGGDPAERTSVAAADARTAALARRVRERLAERSAPLRIEAFNEGTRELGGEITGHGIHVATVKSDDGAARVEWQGDRMSLRVAPGETWQLGVFSLAGGHGELRGQLARADETPRPFQLSPHEDTPRMVVGFDGDEIYAGPEDEAPELESGLRFSFRAPSAPTAAVDAHLERELRALGYVR